MCFFLLSALCNLFLHSACERIVCNITPTQTQSVTVSSAGGKLRLPSPSWKCTLLTLLRQFQHTGSTIFRCIVPSKTKQPFGEWQLKCRTNSAKHYLKASFLFINFFTHTHTHFLTYLHVSFFQTDDLI